MRLCTTSKEVIEAVGGAREFAEWYGVSESAVYQWVRRGFPSRTADKMRPLLRDEKRIEAPPSVWQMDE